MPRNTKMECCNDWNGNAKRGKIGFALFLLVVGIFWLAKDMGYIPALPFWPLIIIFFAVFLLLSKV
jgi:hypothetical protein